MLLLMIMQILLAATPTLAEVAPLVVVFILILAAAGLTKGADMFSLFGIGTLIGLRGSASGGAVGKGARSGKIRTRLKMTLKNPSYNLGSAGGTLRSAVTPSAYKGVMAARNAAKAQAVAKSVTGVLGTTGAVAAGAAVTGAAAAGVAEGLGYGKGVTGYTNLVTDNSKISNFRKGQYRRSLYGTRFLGLRVKGGLRTAEVNLAYAEAVARQKGYTTAEDLQTLTNKGVKPRSWIVLPMFVPIPWFRSSDAKAGEQLSKAQAEYAAARDAFHVQVYETARQAGILPTIKVPRGESLREKMAKAAFTHKNALGDYRFATFMNTHLTTKSTHARRAALAQEHMDKMKREEAITRAAETATITSPALDQNAWALMQQKLSDRLRRRWAEEEQKRSQLREPATATVDILNPATGKFEPLTFPRKSRAEYAAIKDDELRRKLDKLSQKESEAFDNQMKIDRAAHDAWLKHLKVLWSEEAAPTRG